MGVLETHKNVIFAVILRDMRTRFGRSHMGYFIAIAWPLAHLLVIVSVVSFSNRVSPIGSDNSVFVASGVIPYVLCLYPARLIGMSIDMNKPLFLFPVVRTIDIIVSRVIIEFLTAFFVLFLFMCIMSFFVDEILPLNIYNWCGAVLATVYLSISMGVFNAIMTSILKFWPIIFVLFMLLMYFTSGVFIPVERLSQDIKDVLWFNPLLHSVEWLRSSYFEGYGDDMLSISYLFWFATILLFLGLLGEYFLRGKLLSS